MDISCSGLVMSLSLSEISLSHYLFHLHHHLTIICLQLQCILCNSYFFSVVAMYITLNFFIDIQGLELTLKKIV